MLKFKNRFFLNINLKSLNIPSVFWRVKFQKIIISPMNMTAPQFYYRKHINKPF